MPVLPDALGILDIDRRRGVKRRFRRRLPLERRDETRPARATRAMPQRSGLILGFGVGTLGYALGILLSAVIDLPTGAMVVWALAAVSTVFVAWRSFCVGRAKT